MLMLILFLSTCGAPAYYSRLEDPREADICVAHLLGHEPATTMPIFIIRSEPWWVLIKNTWVLVLGTFQRAIDPSEDVIHIADGPLMAETVIHEFGHRHGLTDVYGEAETLVERMDECRLPSEL